MPSPGTRPAPGNCTATCLEFEFRTMAAISNDGENLGGRAHLQGTHFEGGRKLHRGDLEGERELNGGVHGASRLRCASGLRCTYGGWSSGYLSGWDLDRFRHGYRCGCLRD